MTPFLLSQSEPITIAQTGFDTSETILSLVILVILLLSSAMISGSEAAFFSLSPSDKEELRDDESKRAKTVLKLLNVPKELLATILVVNNFANVGIVILSTWLINSLFDGPELTQFIIEIFGITFVLLLLGEVIPKVYANQNSLRFSLWMARPLKLLSNTPPFSWVKYLLVHGTSVIQKRAKRKGVKISSDELEAALELTREEDEDDDEHKILEGIVRFGNTDVKQIMKPRMEVIAIPNDMQFDEILQIILDSGYSRIPVFEDSFDKIVGILFIKDLLSILNQNETLNWLDLIREPLFVPENKKIDDLLQEFQEKKMHMAIVVDEYGGSSGIVTLEDILEEIVGDITDEFDDIEVVYTKIDDATFLFEGKTSLVDFYKIVDIDGKEFEAQKGDAETLGGFIVEKAGKILKNNEFIEFNSVKLIVESSDKKRIKMVKAILQEETSKNKKT